MKKLNWVLGPLLILLFVYGYRSFTGGFENFSFFTADCTIFSRSGTVLYYSRGQLCDFSNDGKVISSDPLANKLQLTDKDETVLWASHENVHHDLKFSNDQNSILLISSEIIDYDGQSVRSDCFSKRNLKNTILAQWCLSQNLKVIQRLGFTIRTQRADQFAITDLTNAEYEISHANTIYEIKKNRLSEKNEAFKEGNFLVDLHGPIFALLILDQNMKRVLWAKNLGRQKYGIDYLSFEAHDSQVTEDGKILSYINIHKTFNLSIFANSVERFNIPTAEYGWGSSLVKFDPYLESVDWIYQASPKFKFRSRILGSVTELKNGNFLFSDISEKVPSIYEVNRDRRVIWRFALPFNSSGKIRKTKPLYQVDFLKARGLIP